MDMDHTTYLCYNCSSAKYQFRCTFFNGHAYLCTVIFTALHYYHVHLH